MIGTTGECAHVTAVSGDAGLIELSVVVARHSFRGLVDSGASHNFISVHAVRAVGAEM